ncbi:protein arginine N-methyltransferase 9-like [Leptopilina boulardi]|uniref:protein arginine N-methyltransferase 9-like n=1 Tax=Leptopilina boulardi TaxID=63433 RepID=UPI0021F5A5E4|nr:protein arginine N-methyltransferase 9-like [Leptopilina boulardi]XP_051165178.1 protein arginine N-methyltransferase 9-like [Leptopilina boulardi]
MQAEVKAIVQQSLKKAREHDSRGNVGQAYAYFTAVVELSPENRSTVEKEFTDVLCEWGMQLEQNNRMKDVIKCYEHSLEHYPKNSRMLNNFAAHLLRNEEPMKAIKYLKQALEADSNFLPAERNLQNAYSMAVDRWHFPMLNDKQRNHAFDKAIRKKIALGYDLVLDIGTGTGLLSLYAQDAGAVKIFACESSSTMSEIARNVFHENNASAVKLISKMSTDLKIKEDIPERVKLIVTETFDAGLFGELVVPTLIDAHERLLSDSGIVIPSNATLYVAAIECEYIRFHSSVRFCNAHHFGELNFKKISLLPDESYYDTENLQNVKISHITEPRDILHVNFNDFNELSCFTVDGVKNLIQVECRYAGIIDGLVAWFKLHLDEEITIDSSQGKSCWQIAVFPSIPTNCEQGDKIFISAEMASNKLRCCYKRNRCEEIEEEIIFHVNKEVIMFLNDTKYISSLIQEALEENDEIESILDTCPFPIYGLTVMKNNSNCKILYYQSDDLMLCTFINKVFEDSQIKGEIRFINDFSKIRSKLDRIFIHNFDIKGELKDWGQERYHDSFSCLLNPKGNLLPTKIFLMGQLVFSEDLPKMVRVKNSNLQRFNASSEKNSDDDNSCESNPTLLDESSNYKIAEFINEYQINQVFDLNSSLYQHEVVSEVKTLLEMDETEIRECVVNFGKFQTTKKLPNALLVWFRIHLSENNVCETKRDDSFMNHMAVVMEDEIKNSVQLDNEVIIKILQMRDLIRISVGR